jgi:hypothetical protein
VAVEVVIGIVSVAGGEGCSCLFAEDGCGKEDVVPAEVVEFGDGDPVGVIPAVEMEMPDL